MYDDPFDDFFPPLYKKQREYLPKQLTQARWLMKLKCRRLRLIRSHLRSGTWRYFIHGDLETHREQLRQMYDHYQDLRELYDIEMDKE